MADEEELEMLRKRRLQQLQQRMAIEEAEEGQRQEDLVAAQRQQMLRRFLTPEARERLARIKMARPEYAGAVEQQLLNLSTRMSKEERIDDVTLKKILHRIMPKKREIKIERR
ncbi:MAG: DNA-binding protein [Candidatus Thermoplasmatota archaeon]|jgi:programmed cell death protein 5|nr:DNA-binding protein [Candidatus Thermoplasmatota archaeon]